jgi:hypothetical protein
VTTVRCIRPVIKVIRAIRVIKVTRVIEASRDFRVAVALGVKARRVTKVILGLVCKDFRVTRDIKAI